MGFNCLKTTEPLRGGTLLFTTKLPSILSFQNIFCQLFFNSYVLIANSDVMFLRDLVPFIQFKKRENLLFKSKVCLRDTRKFYLLFYSRIILYT